MKDSSNSGADSSAGSSLSFSSGPAQPKPEQPSFDLLSEQGDAPTEASPHSAVVGSGRSGSAPTHSFQEAGASSGSEASRSEFLSAQQGDATIVSQRPVAAPAEFYKSMPLAELSQMLEGKQLDHFTVEQIIGGGGMGAVFRGRDLRLDRAVAIKVIPGSKRDPETLRRFRLEAQAAARLDHPNIARVYYVGEAEQWNYIVFEFIDGVNVRDLVSVNGPLPIDDAVFYVRQIAEALQHAHEREVVHRDIKPSNVLVTAAGVSKIVDMGLARNLGVEQSNDATASGITLGTFDYISPEQARNPRDADVRSDLYSLGCTFFYMLTGNPPFPEGTVLQKLLKHGSVPPPDPRGWRDDISDQLHSIIMKLMAKQPNQRYQKPSELVNDLMLLAELEDLPRSQSPGTLLVAPSLAQKSLLESNLSWLVPLAFLLGSTVWLQSLQALSQGYSLRPLDFADLDSLPTNNTEGRFSLEPSAVEGAPQVPETQPRLPDAPDSITSPQATGLPEIPQPFVVSEIRPADVPESRWANSLNAALRRLEGESQPEVEIQGIIELTEPLIVDRDMTLRGSTSGRSKILLNRALMRQVEGGGRSAILVDNAQVELERLEIEVAADTRSQTALFSMQGDAQVNFQGSRITLDDDGEALSVFLIDETLNEPTDILEDDGGKDLSVSLDGCDIRGRGSLLTANVDLGRSNRVALSFKECMVAISGHVVHAQNTPGGWGAENGRNIRVFCDQSTFLTQKPFALISYDEISQPLLSLNRTSRSCVFETVSSNAHITIRGLGQDDLLANLNRFLLKGSDNAYGEGVKILCECYDADDTEIFTFDFGEAARDGWLDERGNDQVVNWLRKPEVSLKLADLTRAELRVAEGPFSPGFSDDSATTSF